MTEDTRDLFERTFALCDRQKWQHKDGSYKDASIQAKWEGWQAANAAALQAQTAAHKPVAAIDQNGEPSYWHKHFTQEPWASRFRPCYLHPAPAPTAPTADPQTQAVYFYGLDPLQPVRNPSLPMIPDSWRFGFFRSDKGLNFGAQDNGPFVAWEAVKDLIAAPAPTAPALKPWDDLVAFVAERFPAPEPSDAEPVAAPDDGQIK